MAIVVVGGQTRNIGKTSAVAGLIAALPDRQWTAFKITQFGHGICSAHGEPCHCETEAHTVAVTEERERENGADSARFLKAGAVRSFWVRTRQGHLAEAIPRIKKEIEKSVNVIVESNSILHFVQPNLYLTVLDPLITDFKPSAQYFLDRADAVLWSGASGGQQPETAAWPENLLHLTWNKPHFFVGPPQFTNDELTEFVAMRVFAECSSHSSQQKA